MNLRGILLAALFAAVAAVGLAMLFFVATDNAGASSDPVTSPGRVEATTPNHPKVTICHRTNSVTNPYVRITVDAAAVDGFGNNDHTHHLGPVAYSQAYAQQLKDAHQNWGDIIPPHPDNALNWSAVGQAVYNNGCNYLPTPTPTPTPTSTPTPTPPVVTPTPTPTPCTDCGPMPTPAGGTAGAPAPVGTGTVQAPAPVGFPDTGGMPPGCRNFTTGQLGDVAYNCEQDDNGGLGFTSTLIVFLFGGCCGMLAGMMLAGTGRK